MVVKTGIYVRVSTEEQAEEGFSIRAQTEKLKSYVFLKDWELYDIYSDEGISGKNIVDRPAINRLINDIKAGKVNNVLVFKVDRLTRSIKNLMELVELFDEYKCSFNSLTESIDTETPSGRMFLKIIGIFAEFERENIVTRTRLGFERKVKEGYTLATRTPSYGYERETGQKIQTVNPAEAAIVREIFDLYVNQNESLTHIAKILNDRKIPTKENGKWWCATRLRNILQNPTYIGKVRYCTKDKERYFENEGHHEAIIDEATFMSAQERWEKNKTIYRTKKPKEDQYFCGFLYCAKCGYKFSTHHSYHKVADGEVRCHNAYRCTGKVYKVCKTPDISHEKIEELFFAYISKIADLEQDETLILNDDGQDAKNTELLRYINECETKLQNQERQRKQVMEQYMNADISFDEYRTLIEISNQKCAGLEQEIEIAKSKISEQTPPELTEKDVILNLKENWEYLNNNERMMFLQKFVKKIIIDTKREGKWSTCEITGVEFN